MSTKWNVTFQVYRQKARKAPYFQEFQMEVDPDEYVLDAIERIWAFKDRSLVFRHACHHSVCGACGMRLNGVEKLTCITLFRQVTHDGGSLKVEPLRNFPVVSDLLVDMSAFYRRMEAVGFKQVAPLSEAPLIEGIPAKNGKTAATTGDDLLRLVDCIECGMCISACPVAATTPDYLGPAVLAAAQQTGVEHNPQVLQMVDSAGGVWRCHSAYECTAVCPANVEPAWRIMDLRKRLVGHKLKSLLPRL